MFRPSFSQIHALLFIGLTLLTSAAPVAALPNQLTRSSVTRRANSDPFDGPKSFQTVTTSNVNGNVITQTCQVKLTPVQQNGQNMVREEKSCTVSMRAVDSPAPPAPPAPPPPAPPSGNGGNNGNGGNSGNNGGNNGNNGGNTQQSSSAKSAPSSTAPPPPQQSSAAPPPPPPASSPPTSSSASANSQSSAAGQSSSAPPTITTSAPPAPPTSSDASQSTSSAAPSGSAAASQTTDAPAFQVPGKKLEVLPIGLGVFAGISVIALIVVGLVTYERTKHRRVFRQRKLAEMGQDMGYSGTAGARV